jgi:hypothetical protein
VTAFTGQEIRTAWAQAVNLVPFPIDMFSEELIEAVRSVPELAVDWASPVMRARFVAHLVVNRIMDAQPTGRLTPPVEPIHIPGKSEWYGPDEMTPNEGSKSDDTKGHQRG